jgi:hypothetical protein
VSAAFFFFFTFFHHPPASRDLRSGYYSGIPIAILLNGTLFLFFLKLIAFFSLDKQYRRRAKFQIHRSAGVALTLNFIR